MFFKEPVACSALKIKMSVIYAQKYLQALRMTYYNNVNYYKLPIQVPKFTHSIIFTV